ncbi:MAG: DUF6427 family protein [Maribacter sp.]
MISSIFSKTKPINFIILMVFLFLFYGSVQFYFFDQDISNLNLGSTLLIIITLLFSVFIVDFIIKRNKLTGTNAFGILYFTLLFVVFPETLKDGDAIFSNFFLLLAIRRLLSIKSLKDIKFKIFDAGLWICVSSIFNEWSILYILLVFAAIYIYEPKNIRNWLVMLSVGFCFISLLYAILILTDNTEFLKNHYDFTIRFEILDPSNWWSSLKLSVYVIVNVVLAFWTFLRLNKGGVIKVVVMRLIALYFVIGLLVNLLVSSSVTNAVVFTFFPSVIFIVTYLESIKKPKVLELLLIASIVVPLVVYFAKL